MVIDIKQHFMLKQEFKGPGHRIQTNKCNGWKFFLEAKILPPPVPILYLNELILPFNNISRGYSIYERITHNDLVFVIPTQSYTNFCFKTHCFLHNLAKFHVSITYAAKVFLRYRDFKIQSADFEWLFCIFVVFIL